MIEVKKLFSKQAVQKILGRTPPMTNDKPPIAPVEGHYAMLRNGMIASNIRYTRLAGLMTSDDFGFQNVCWEMSGKSTVFNDTTRERHDPDLDIIATISPEAMALAALSKPTAREAMMKLDAKPAKMLGFSLTNGARNAEHTFDEPVPIPAGDYTIMPTKLADALQALIALADAACDYADSHCRAFPISTAPRDGTIVMFYVPAQEYPFTCRSDDYWNGADWLKDATHWRPLPPPPSNPPLPAVFVELGQALEKLKEGR